MKILITQNNQYQLKKADVNSTTWVQDYYFPSYEENFPPKYSDELGMSCIAQA